MDKKSFDELQEIIKEIQDQHERELAQGYLDTLVLVQLELAKMYEEHAVDGVITIEELNRSGQLRRVEKELTKKINELTPVQNQIIKQNLEDVYEETYYRNSYWIDKKANLATPIFTLLAAKILKDIIFNPKDNIRWTERNRRNNRRLSSELKTIIRRGVTNGHGYDKIVKAITKQIGIGQRRVIRIAQTEAGRVYSSATQQSMEDAVAMGVNLKKRWLSTLDSRTRHTHQGLDGQTIEVHERFISPSGYMALEPRMFGIASEDINCRCTTIAIFEGLEPTTRMARAVDYKMGNIVPYKNYEDWFSSLSR